MNKLIIIISILSTSPVYAFNAKTFYATNCVGCHGNTGEGRSGFSPKLAGQHWPYLRDQIIDIKKGNRTNGISKGMAVIFKPLKRTEIDSLAKYLEKLK